MTNQRVRLRIAVAVIALATAAAVIFITTPARSGGAEVTSGNVEMFAAGEDLGFDIRGGAVMVRLPINGGKTFVFVRVRGLDPQYETYPTHVHNAACASGGGGHYQNVVGGAVDPVNEMWPLITSNTRGVGRGFASHGHWARPEAQSIVIHYPPDTSIRLACIDLS